jgi:methylmalonyl-CoA/ethylmalonyl-CoA epimerase
MKLNLHHVGMLVKKIPEAVEFYVQMGYEIKTPIIHDPIQTAYVRFLKLAADRVFLELVSPDGPDSKLATALQKGEGLNHLCYYTEDIQACCQWLRESGFLLIAEPVAAVAFNGRRVAWFRGAARLLVEVVERGEEGYL